MNYSEDTGTNTHSRAQGHKIVFVLNSAKNEICSACKKLNTKNLNFFLQSRAEHEFFPANKY